MTYTPISFFGANRSPFVAGPSAPALMPGVSVPTGIYPNAPRAIKSYTKKYQQIGPILQQQYGPGIASSLASIEQQRALRGANPMSKEQTMRIAHAAQTGQSNIPERESSLSDIFGNAVGDIYSIGSNILKLPGQVLESISQIPDTIHKLPAYIQQGNIAGALQLPGINLIPGAYTLSNVLSGNFQEMIEHPVFTGLDVLPYASKGIKAAIPKAVSKFEERPILTDAAMSVRGTKPVQFLKGAFGGQSRSLAFIGNRLTTELAEAAHPDMPLGRFGSLPEAQITRAARELQHEFPTIATDEKTLAAIHDVSTLYPDKISTLLPEEQAYLSRYKGITNDLQRHAVESSEKLAFGEWLGSQEVFPREQARALFNARQTADLANSIVHVREGLLSPELPDPAAFAHSAPDAFMKSGFDPSSATARNTYSVKIRKQIATGYARTLDMAGYDVEPIMEAITAAKSRADLATVADQFATYKPTPKPIIPNMDEILGLVEEQAKTGDRIAINASEAVKRGRFDDAVGYLQTIGKRSVSKWAGSGLFDDTNLVIDSLRRYKGAQAFLDETKKWTAKTAATFERRFAKAEQRNLPARFIPKQEQLAQEGMRRYVKEEYADNPDLPQLMKYVEDQAYELLPDFTAGRESLRNVLNPILDDAARSVVDLRRNGFDPLFVHRIGSGAEFAAAVPRVNFREITPSQVKRRIGDGAPSMSNMQVALEHQGMEWLTERGNLEAINEVGSKMGVTQDQLMKEYWPAAERRAARDPSLSVRGHAEQLMRKEWQPFNGEGIVPPSAKLTFDADKTWLPKSIVRNIEKMQKPYEFTGMWDPILNAFRTAVLPLSPRWHAYNIVGGYVMLSAETNPFTAFKYLGDFLELQRDIKAGKTPKIPEQMRVLLGKSSQEARDFAIRAGGDMRRLWDKRSQVDDTTGHYMGQVGKLRDAGKKIVQKSFDFNTLFDDAYRVMAYFYGHDKAAAGKLGTREAAAASEIAKSLDITEAQAAGFNLSRKVMQNWDELTPFERTVVRGIFPFYSWMQHILRFTFRLPADHPVRASILSSFARNELEDFGTALPQRFLNTFFLGNPDPNTGEVTGINLNGMNPFADVANYFTLAGWTSSVNPVFATVLEQMGVDPRTGQQGLFPDTTFDPISGSLKLEAPNPALALMYNTIPQSEVLLTMLGQSTQIKEMMKTDPEAAQRMMQSQLGIPLLWRDYNYPEEVMKAEKNREDVFRNEINEGLKSGRYGKIEQYPALRPWLNQIKQFSNGTVTPYPTTTGI